MIKTAEVYEAPEIMAGLKTGGLISWVM